MEVQNAHKEFVYIKDSNLTLTSVKMAKNHGLTASLSE